MKNFREICLGAGATLRDIMACLDRGAVGIVLLVDDDGHLIRTITDGDVRRALLAGHTVDAELEAPADGVSKKPVVSTTSVTTAKLTELMARNGVRQIPLVDGDGRVIDVALKDELVAPTGEPIKAVVMAGGRGTRLLPLTESTPKPMLPIADRPIMEHVLDNLRLAGLTNVYVTTHYESEAITDHFGDGSRYGLHITYVHEDVPLGTAGALGQLADNDSTLLVINGDILTDLDFQAMLAFHRDNAASMTVGVRQFEIGVPFGVVQLDDIQVKEVTEKPSLRFPVNAGIYLMEPSVIALIKSDQHLDAPELIHLAISHQLSVIAFPIHEYWLDVGRPADFERAGTEWPLHPRRRRGDDHSAHSPTPT